MSETLSIRPAYNDLPEVRELFTEYVNMLGVDLSFQSYAEELANLPGKYSPPRGRLYLAWRGDSAAGVIGLRPYDGQACEMKRLYVRPAHRGKKIGRALVDKIIAEARQEGYSRMILDTLLSLEHAVQIYKDVGFYETEPYYHNPYPGVGYFRLDL